MSDGSPQSAKLFPIFRPIPIAITTIVNAIVLFCDCLNHHKYIAITIFTIAIVLFFNYLDHQNCKTIAKLFSVFRPIPIAITIIAIAIVLFLQLFKPSKLYNHCKVIFRIPSNSHCHNNNCHCNCLFFAIV